MKTILAIILLVGVWYSTSLWADNQAPPDKIENSENEAAETGQSSGASAIGTSSRRLTEEARNDLIAVLSTESGQQVWFVIQPDDPEADAFQLEIEDAFLQSGWKIAASSKFSGPLKAGIKVFAANDVLPEHVSVAVSGLRSIGLDVAAGTGYRAYYDSQKEKNPNFQGIELAPDQDFVIIVGPVPAEP